MKTNMHLNAGPGVFYHARILRNNPTAAEMKLWECLRKNKLGYKFRRQHPCYNYVFDFYCHSYKLVIEIDGGIHEDEAVKLKDQEKENFIHEAGLHLLRFSNEQIMFEINDALDCILEKLLQIKYNAFAEVPSVPPFRG